MNRVITLTSASCAIPSSFFAPSREDRLRTPAWRRCAMRKDWRC